MKKLKYLCSALFVASLLAIPASAQRHPMGRMGQMTHQNNAPDASKGSKAKKTRTREGWEKNAKHKANGHSK